jgi:hypothetical protein
MSTEAQILPGMPKRVETGPIQFGDDWTGYFERGDNVAGGFSTAIMALPQAITTLNKETLSDSAKETIIGMAMMMINDYEGRLQCLPDAFWRKCLDELKAKLLLHKPVS